MGSAGNALSLEDERAIIDGTVRYCWAIDGRNWDELADVFTDDALVKFGVAAPVRGLSEIQSFIARVLTPLDASQHMVTNHRVERDDEGVRSRCYFQAQHVRRGVDGGANYIVAGIYRDVWSESPVGWRIRSRELEVLWTEGNVAVIGAPSRP